MRLHVGVWDEVRSGAEGGMYIPSHWIVLLHRSWLAIAFPDVQQSSKG